MSDRLTYRDHRYLVALDAAIDTTGNEWVCARQVARHTYGKNVGATAHDLAAIARKGALVRAHRHGIWWYRHG